MVLDGCFPLKDARQSWQTFLVGSLSKLCPVRLLMLVVLDRVSYAPLYVGLLCVSAPFPATVTLGKSP